VEGAAEGSIRTSQCALLHPQLLHAALQHERIPTLQCDTEADERIEEEGLGSDLTTSTGQLVQEGAGCGPYSAVALHYEGHQSEAAMLAQRFVARALLLLRSGSAGTSSGHGRVSHGARCGGPRNRHVHQEALCTQHYEQIAAFVAGLHLVTDLASGRVSHRHQRFA